MIEISNKTKKIIEKLFGQEQSGNIENILLQDCSQNVPGCETWSSSNLERVWLSVLKISGGNMQKLGSAVALANTDYRDLFMSAGFGYDADAHLKWQP